MKLCKYLRLSQNMTAAELARRVGCNRTSIYMIENSKERPGSRGPKIADALGWTGEVYELWWETDKELTPRERRTANSGVNLRPSIRDAAREAAKDSRKSFSAWVDDLIEAELIREGRL